jgi:uncharacterized repeat protein (TIGR01451 family)
MTMYKWSMLIPVLVFLLVAGSISCAGPSSWQPPSELTIVSIANGDVLVMKAGTNTWNKASSGMALEAGDRIRSGVGANAVITFFEGSTIELAADTEINVAELGIAEKTGSTSIKVGQQIGKTRSRVKKLIDPASRYEIETPAGVAAVRDSVGDVEVAKDGTTTVVNIEGRWCVSAQGREVCMPQGMKVIIVPGKAPSMPVALPPPPIVPPPTPPSVPSQLAYSARHPSPYVSPPTAILSPAIALTKTADKTQAHDGDTITYTYQVTNPGNTPLSNVTVTDDKAGNASYQSGDSNGNNELDIGETWVFTATYAVSSEDASPLVNTATASGSDALSQVVTAKASAGVTILRPAIALTKTADSTEIYVQGTITYTYQVTNPGNTPLSGVSVTDNKVGTPTYQSGDTNGDNKLDVGEIWVFTAIYMVSGLEENPLVNIATTSGSDALSRVVTAQDSASVEIIIEGIGG